MSIKQYQDTVFLAAKGEGVPEDVAEIIVKQAMHESGQFTSHVFETDNNAFGMKMPSVRKSPFIQRPSDIVMKSEGSTPYAHYKSLEDSTRDLVHWLKYKRADFKKIDTEEKYAAWLKSVGYYGDSQDNYTDALLRYVYDAKTAVGHAINQNQGAVVATGVTITLMLFYFIARAARAKKK